MSYGDESGGTTVKVLIICWGNPLRSDDGLGWRAAEQLARRFRVPWVEVVTLFQLTPELTEALHKAQCVFFIDARGDGQAGALTFSPVLPSGEPSSSHHLSPAALVELTRRTYGSAPRAYIASICGECFDFGEHLSATVAGELPRLTSLVIRAAEQMAQPMDHPSTDRTQSHPRQPRPRYLSLPSSRFNPRTMADVQISRAIPPKHTEKIA
jgi:hydrogenase maturation protease